jgi:hypothetical protein
LRNPEQTSKGVFKVYVTKISYTNARKNCLNPCDRAVTLPYLPLELTIAFSDLGKETPMVEVTESASKAIKAFMAEKSLDSALRVYLQSGG